MAKINKCIGDDTKAAARQSLNCIKNKKNEIWRKTIFNMADWILTPCNVPCGTITTFISSGDCTLQCGMWLWNRDSEFTKWQAGSTLQCDIWLWHDMKLNSPKRPPYSNSTVGFHFHTSPQSTCHSVPVCEILSKSDHPRRKNDVMSIFMMADVSHLGL